MTVFKTYWRLIRSLFPVIILYLSIFLVLSIIMGSIGTEEKTFSMANPKVLLIDHDQSTLSKGFHSFLKEHAKLVQLKEEEDRLEDALFYRQVDYIIEIPEDYAKNFQQGEKPKLKTKNAPGSTTATYTEMLCNRYFQLARTYQESYSEEEYVPMILEDLKSGSEAILLNPGKEEIQKVESFFNYTNYTILALCLCVIGIITHLFLHPTIKKRNQISSMSSSQLNKKLFLGHFLLMCGNFLLYVLMGLCLYPSVILSIQGLLFLVNMFCFHIMALSLGFFLGNLIKSREAQNGLVNVIALGTSFLCGAFVPQEYLGKGVLTFSKVLPSYWYILGNHQIASLQEYNLETLLPLGWNILILLGSAFIFFLLTNIVSHFRQHEQ